MSEELTKKEALLRCIEMWEFLAKHPRMGKERAIRELWPNLKEPPDADCWACEYDNQGDGVCTDCPIYRWREEAKKSSLYEKSPCIREHSPYKKWFQAKKLKDKTKYALQIAELAKESLK